MKYKTTILQNHVTIEFNTSGVDAESALVEDIVIDSITVASGSMSVEELDLEIRRQIDEDGLGYYMIESLQPE